MRWCNSSISDSLGDFCVLSADRFVKCIRKFTVDLFRTWNLLIHMALLSLLFRFATAKWTKLPLTNVPYRYISADSGLCDVRMCMEVFFDPHHNITISYILHCRGSVRCGRRGAISFRPATYPTIFPLRDESPKTTYYTVLDWKEMRKWHLSKNTATILAILSKVIPSMTNPILKHIK